MPKATAAAKKAKLGDVFTYQEARAAGLSHRRIYAMRDAGELTSLGGGVYRRADAPLADVDLIEIAERVPLGTLCLETALARHGLLDAIPLATEIAIPRGNHRPALKAPHRLHNFDRATFDVGRELIEVGSRRPLGIYSAERSLVDLVRLRHDQGSDQAWEAFRRWLATPGRNPGKLVRLAAQFHGAEAPLRRALEVLL